MPRQFRVMFDFQSAGEAELSVSAGQVVIEAVDTEAQDNDGWTEVVQPETGNVGFVPTEYLKEMEAEAPASRPQLTPQDLASGAGSEAGEQPVLHASTSTAGGAAAATQRQETIKTALQYDEEAAPARAAQAQPNLAAQQQQQQQEQQQQQQQQEQPVFQRRAAPPAQIQAELLEKEEPRGGAIPSVSPTSSLPGYGLGRDTTSSVNSHTGGIVESFMKNEVYFRSLMKQRQETFMRLDGCIADTASELSACKAKNQLLAKKIRELDNMIDEDRAKWRSRIEEEKALLTSQASSGTRSVF